MGKGKGVEVGEGLGVKLTVYRDACSSVIGFAVMRFIRLFRFVFYFRVSSWGSFYFYVCLFYCVGLG